MGRCRQGDGSTRFVFSKTWVIVLPSKASIHRPSVRQTQRRGVRSAIHGFHSQVVSSLGPSPRLHTRPSEWELVSSFHSTRPVMSRGGTGAGSRAGASELSPFCGVLGPGVLSITLAGHSVGMTEMLVGECSGVRGCFQFCG